MRGRQVTVASTLAGVLVAVVAVFLVVVVPRDRDAAPEPGNTASPSSTPAASPASTPSPAPDASPTHASDTSMTPREVVLKPNARLLLTGVSADDPDFRFSVWTAPCPWCPNDDEPRGRPRFYGMAITTDGFATATYRRPGWDLTGLEHVESVGPGLLLILDVGNQGPGRLLRDDGTLTRLAQVVEDRPAPRPRLWHLCHDLNVEGQVEMVTWCALDPASNTQYVWHDPWRNPLYDPAAVGPGSGERPWGFVDPPDDHLVAYWWDGGTRRTRDFGPADSKGAVTHTPAGTMAVWSLDERSRVVTIHSSSDGGASWRVTDMEAPYYSSHLDLVRTPGGALLAKQDDAWGGIGNGVSIWRADSMKAAGFDVVYAAKPRTDGPALFAPSFSELEGRIWAGGLYSDDDGRTWSAIPRWR
jgi:hypothetical protein